jgi:molybdopterin/thiamine biosynthesis adenylyltransferase
LSEESIFVVGAGGLGVPAAIALARAGAAIIGIIDPERIELSNLARQVIYQTSDVGRIKVEAAAERITALCPSVTIRSWAQALDASNARELIDQFGCVIDATDDPTIKFLINDVCIDARIPFVYGGVLGMTGQAMTVLPGRSPCLRCLFEEPPGEAEAASCRDAGILGPIAGAIGEAQAAEAIALVRGKKPQLAGRMLIYDATIGPRIRITEVAARSGCRCGAARSAPARATA